MKTRLTLACLALLSTTAAAGSTEEPDQQDPPTTEQRIATLEEEVARLAAAQEDSEPEGGAISAKWDGKLKFATADGSFTAQLGGRLNFDAGTVSEDDDWKASVGGSQPDGAEVRRARIYLSGTIDERLDYKWQVDFAGGGSSLKDFYAAFKDTPIGRIQGGQFKENFGLEQLTSSNDISTQERSAASEAFGRSRSLGLQVSDHDQAETFTWALGAFKDDPTDSGISFSNGDENFTARVTTALLKSKEDRRVLHLGGAYRLASPFNRVIRYRARGSGTHLLADRAVDTGNIPADGADEWGLEAAWVQGPFSLQGEYMMASVDASGQSDPDFNGWYALISYFLTGESRSYKPSTGAFSSVKPKRPLGQGPGAWELIGRYSFIDLDDASVSGGELADVTLGVNWYVNQNSRIMLSLAQGELGGSRDGTAQVVAARWQVAF